MKLHIGVDSRSGLTHHAVVTAANVHDKHPLPRLLHGDMVWSPQHGGPNFGAYSNVK